MAFDVTDGFYNSREAANICDQVGFFSSKTRSILSFYQIY